ncbi:MAG: hypothetical protein CML02_22230 [Pseudooceanicola sp.]|jgi:hypothetical protein|nr:hypothetical protein [Pseudooceanicola sp.]|tara:strand:+ start:61 stop:693 length:633 start_codon:yes stop_codon:yes gene_type:complete
MPDFNTLTVTSDPEVVQRLADWNLTVDQIVAIGDTARRWAEDASPLAPLNAPGQLAYLFGVQELRQQLIGDGFVLDRSCNIEAVVNTELGVRIGYQNVDRSCDPDLPPIPRTSKGKGAEYLNGPDLFEHVGMVPGPLTGVREDAIPTYYVMVGEDGSIELSRAIIKNGKYERFVERIFVRSPSEDWEGAIEPETGPVEDFDIQVSFKDDQ